MDTVTPKSSLSIVIPAKNEMATIEDIVAGIRHKYPDAEIVVVDDGSTDSTGILAAEAGARVVRHPESLGNGAAIKSGARTAIGDILCFMDADGQHDPDDIVRLFQKVEEGYDMVIRHGHWSQNFRLTSQCRPLFRQWVLQSTRIGDQRICWCLAPQSSCF